MIVCLCRGINDRQLRQEAILAGGDVSRVMQSTGAGTVCGSCCQKSSGYAADPVQSVLLKPPKRSGPRKSGRPLRPFSIICVSK